MQQGQTSAPARNVTNKTSAKNWVFTYNNYDGTRIKDILANIPCEYIAFQGEIGENGTPHIQGVVSLERRTSLLQIRDLFSHAIGSPSPIHFEVMRGTIQQAVDYCSKTETADPNFPFTERGTRPAGKGARTDLSGIAEAIRSGASERDVFEIDPTNYLKYSAGIKRAIYLCASTTTRRWKTEVFWFHGPTGTGKSRTAHEEAPTAHVQSGNDYWWDGYSGQDDVIIEDYRASFCPFAELLRLLDRYPHQVQIKGGKVHFLARRVFITTPRPPKETWEKQTEEAISQLTRRIDHVRYFPALFAPPALTTVETGRSLAPGFNPIN
jgi:hypothetical protein